MPIGLFGKYPAKRDFIALGVPRPVLEPVETWLQAGVAASRQSLGRSWQDLYLVAPLWRFWIGPEVFGVTCTGATMPSVDAIGRFFPLTLIACGEPGLAKAVPTHGGNDEWYREVEARLLQAIGEAPPGEPASLLEGLEPPGTGADPDREGAAQDRLRGCLWRSRDGAPVDRLLAAIARDADRAAHGGRTVLWTAGGPQRDAEAFSCAGLPDPYFYAHMIGGTP